MRRLSGEQFKQVAALDWLTVHYTSGAPAMQDMLSVVFLLDLAGGGWRGGIAA